MKPLLLSAWLFWTFFFGGNVAAQVDGPGLRPPAAAAVAPDPIAALAQFAQGLGIASSGDEFLEPDLAFIPSARAKDRGTVVVRWVVAEGYYLYRDKFNFAVADPKGLRLGPVTLPDGTSKSDEFFGQVEVYYGTTEAKVSLPPTADGLDELTLSVRYQGCADAGLCYPPITKQLIVALPAVAPPAGGFPDVDSGTRGVVSGVADPFASTDGGDAVLSEEDRIARSLAVGSLSVVLLSFFGFGLLLTFTPCVFPLIPILSSIIVGQGEGISTRKALVLSSTYVLAMAATYTVAGVIAGSLGHNLQAAFQEPWVLSAFSAVFVLLALSMFGFYELQIPRRWQEKLIRISNRQEGGTFVGVAIMGFLSALIVGPCIAPPLAGALVYISQTGDGLLGGAALFALSLGMGAPLLVIGTTAGKFLPAVGAWMNTIKAVFGVVLLGVAIYLIERLVAPWIVLLLWAVLFMVTAIYMGALDTLSPDAGGWRRLSKGTGLVVLVYGVLLMVGASGGGRDIFQPLRDISFSGDAREHQELVFKRVKGVEDLQKELQVAAGRGQVVMLDYYADWCISCKEMEKYTFSDPGVQSFLATTVLLQTDVTSNDAADQAILKRFGLFGPPAILFFGPDGQERRRYRVVGFMDAETFRDHLKMALG